VCIIPKEFEGFVSNRAGARCLRVLGDAQIWNLGLRVWYYL
jgi:hypothetical protein